MAIAFCSGIVVGRDLEAKAWRESAVEPGTPLFSGGKYYCVVHSNEWVEYKTHQDCGGCKCSKH